MKTHQHTEHDLNVKKIDRLSSTRVRLTVEFPADSVKEHEIQMVRRYLAQAKIPGFRVGKAPLEIVRKRFGEDIKKEVVSHLLEAGLSEALQRTKLIPVNRPNISLGESPIQLDQAFEFHAEFEVQPEIELRSYKDIPVRKLSTEVSEEEVAKGVEDLRERFASLEPSDQTKAQKELFAIAEVGYSLTGDPSKKEEPKSLTIELGKENVMPEIENALLEMSVGEERQVTATFPETHSNKDLANKEASFTIKLVELKKKKLPELNDEWANELRPGSTVEKLREEMRNGILGSKTEQQKRQQKDDIVSYLIKNNTFDVSPSLVERQAYRLLESLHEDYQRQGIKPPPLKEEEVQSIRSRAEQMVRGSLLLKEVALKEKIEVDKAKVNARVEEIGAQVGRSVDEVRKLLSGRSMMQQIEDEVLTEQVFEFLLAHAKQTQEN